MFEDIQQTLEEFIDQLIESIAAALNVNIDAISIIDVYAGSVKADIEVAAETPFKAQILSEEVALLAEALEITGQFGTAPLSPLFAFMAHVVNPKP